VATLKHDRGGFEMDHPGKDTWRHAQAGSDIVAISSPAKVAMIWTVQEEMALDQVVQMLPRADIVLVEGYKQEHKPKIEVSRSELGSDLLCEGDDLIAVVTDRELPVTVPQFDTSDASGVADLLEEHIMPGAPRFCT
jgi:molybdopterin-guanine dinucleotide biosynthesis protein B